MKKFFQISGILLLATALLSSCGKKYPEQLKVIPKNAASIAGININVLGDSLAKDNVSLDSLLDNIEKSVGETPANRKNLDDLKNSGIDFGNTVYVFGTQTNSVSKGTVRTVNLAATLKDEKRLDSFLAKHPGTGNTQTGKGFSYRLLNRNVAIAWHDHTVVLSSYIMVQEKVFDSSINRMREEQAAKVTENLLAEVEKLFNLKEDESAASLDGLVELVNSKPHAFAWNNMDDVLKAYMAGMPLALGLSEIFRDNFVATQFNFERGKVAAHTKAYFNPGMQALLKEHGNAQVKIDMLKNYPSQHIDAAFTASINPQMLPALLKLSSTESIANLGLSAIGLNAADATAWMKGDIAVVLSDFSLGSATELKNMSLFDLGNIKPSWKFLATIPVGNKAALDKVIAASSKFVEDWEKQLQEHQLRLKITSDNVFITNDTTLIQQYLAATQANAGNAQLKEMEGKMAAGYIDINKTVQGVTVGKAIPVIDSFQQKLDRTFGNAVFTVNNFDGKVITADAELRLKDATMNSASVLINLLSNSIGQYHNYMIAMEKDMTDRAMNMKPADIQKMIE